MFETFRDREAAGRELAERVAQLALQRPVVVALPRGGVPVAAKVAIALNAPLDLVMVRKLGAPGQPELAVGAVVDGDHPEVVIDERLAALTGADRDHLETGVRDALREIERRRRLYLRGREPPSLQARDVVVVDDGIATGASMKAALRALRRRRPARLVLAVPVAPAETIHDLSPIVDAIVCLSQPAGFEAVGAYYDRFPQVEDEEVIATLRAVDAARHADQDDARAH